MVDCGDQEFYVAEDAEAAGEAARAYWEEMANDDPQELVHMIGESVLVNWALGISDGPGSEAVYSLHEWLDLWQRCPEEHWASYDGLELTVTHVTVELEEELGFVPTVAYRHN